MADINEVVVTLTEQNGSCSQCDMLKTEVDDLKRELGLIRARDTMSSLVPVVYD